MKKIISIVFIVAAQAVFGQVAIGKTTVDGSAILDFGENTNKGIILPWIEDLTKVTHSAGTFLYDATDKKVKWFDGTAWNDLSVHTGAVDLTEVKDLQESGAQSGAIIGDVANAPIGVLVLNKPGKALVLPKSTEPWLNIKQPEPGTMVYDTTNNLICVFNGTEWTFWGK